MVKIFISYSHVDVQFKEQLEKHLAALRRNGEIAPWTDTMISPSEIWSEEISKSLKAADIIICLISSDFINSDYCYEVEMKNALKRHVENRARIIPIIIRSCDWNDTAFSQLQVLPTAGKPVKEWADQDQAYLDVVEGLKKAIRLLSPVAERAVATPAAPVVADEKSIEDRREKPKKRISWANNIVTPDKKPAKTFGKKAVVIAAILLIILVAAIYILRGNKTEEIISAGQPIVAFMKGLSMKDLLLVCLVGGIAGWIVGNLVVSANSLFLDVLIGIAGGYLCVRLFGGYFSLAHDQLLNKIITASIGAAILAFVIKQIRGFFSAY